MNLPLGDKIKTLRQEHGQQTRQLRADLQAKQAECDVLHEVLHKQGQERASLEAEYRRVLEGLHCQNTHLWRCLSELETKYAELREAVECIPGYDRVRQELLFVIEEMCAKFNQLRLTDA